MEALSITAPSAGSAPILRLPVEVKNELYSLLILNPDKQGKPTSASRLQHVCKGMRTKDSSTWLSLIKAFNENHSSADKNINDARLPVQFHAQHYSRLHNESLLKDALDIKSPYHVQAKALLSKKLKNDSFVVSIDPSENFQYAVALIPVLGDSAKDFVERHLPEATDSHLSLIVVNTSHLLHQPVHGPLLEKAKLRLTERLNNDSFTYSSTPSSNVFYAVDLIPFLGDSAINFALQHSNELAVYDLLKLVKSPNHPIHDAAKSQLTHRLNNDTFLADSRPSVDVMFVGIKDVFDLIPVLGDSANNFIDRHIHKLDDLHLINMAENPMDSQCQQAKLLLGYKLDNNTFKIGSIKNSVEHASRLKPILGDSANNFIDRHIRKLDDLHLIKMAENPMHSLCQQAKLLLGYKLDNNTFEIGSIKNSVEHASRLKPILGAKARNFVHRNSEKPQRLSLSYLKYKLT